MTRIGKPMLPIAALFAGFLFAGAAHAATEPPDPCSLLTPAQVSTVLSETVPFICSASCLRKR
jgi:hypothetical protein